MIVVPPPEWGEDDITRFIDQVRSNAYATFFNLKPEFSRFSGIDSVFRKLIANLSDTGDWFAAFFLLRAHASFLGAVSSAIGGQIPEAYALLRLSLEQSIYGIYVSRTPAARESWLRRHDSEAHEKAMRKEFQMRRLFDHLSVVAPAEAKPAEDLYDRTIDHGAHPNERALSQILTITRAQGKVDFKISYSEGDGPALRYCMRSAAQVGVCVLGIFAIVFEGPFNGLGLTDDLQRLRQGL